VLTGMSGAGIMLMSADLSQGTLCTTDAVSALIEKVQFALNEGPCVDAFREGRPVMVPDLANARTDRWIGFSGPLLEAGVGAVFGFPLRVGAARLGALNLYRDRPGALTDDQHAEALLLAEVVAEAVLLLQARAPLGSLAVELDAGTDFHLVVHQAAGMVAIQLEASIAEAMIRLRAYAFGNDRSLTDVAKDVVDRRLRFDPRDETDDEQ
jgi:GAF domain-containing protein